MMRYLNAAARECWACVHHATGKCDTWCDNGEAFELREDVKNAPTVDAVPVVRCKDCIYFSESPNNPIGAGGLCECIYKYTDFDNFCSYGERKEE